MKNKLALLITLIFVTGCSSSTFLTDQITDTTTSTNSDLLFEDDFSSDNNLLFTGSDDSGKGFYSDGQYGMQTYASNHYSWNAIEGDYADAVINIVFHQVSGDENLTGTIILWRVLDEDNFYSLLITGSGVISIDKIVNNEWNSILEPTSASSFNSDGAYNKITIASKNDTSDIYLNDQFVFGFRDSSFTSGYMGFGAVPDKTSAVEVAFDRLTIYEYDPSSSHTPRKPDLTPTPAYISLTWTELANFLARDHTNWNEYDYENYNCMDYAIDLVENAKSQNIKAWIVGVDFTNGESGHAFVGFETSDKGTIYVEPQGDNTYSNVSVGNFLCDDWGQSECMGIIKSIEYYGECNHQHYCTDYAP